MAVKTVYCNAVSDFPPLKKESTAFSLTFDDAECHIYYDGTEYVFRFSATLDASCLFPQDMKPLLDSLFAQNVAILCDLKAYLHKLHDFGIKIDKAEDVSLLRYLSDSNLRAPNEKEFSKDFALPDENCAYGLYLAYQDAYKRLSGTEGETIYREIELPLAYVLYEMEKTGVRVDTRKFDDFSDKFNREISALSEKVRAEQLVVVDEIKLPAPKTKEMAKVLAALKLDKRVLLVVTDADADVVRAANNLENVKTLPSSQINVYDVVANTKLLATKAAITKIEEAYKA